MKLSKDSVIAHEKITGYLLLRRPVGDKSEFLKQAGYTLENWRQLEYDIRQQILSKEAVLVEHTEYGDIFEIRALLSGPNGVSLRIISVWIREAKTGITKFVTLYPDKGRER